MKEVAGDRVRGSVCSRRAQRLPLQVFDAHSIQYTMPVNILTRRRRSDAHRVRQPLVLTTVRNTTVILPRRPGQQPVLLLVYHYYGKFSDY